MVVVGGGVIGRDGARGASVSRTLLRYVGDRNRGDGN